MSSPHLNVSTQSKKKNRRTIPAPILPVVDEDRMARLGARLNEGLNALLEQMNIGLDPAAHKYLSDWTMDTLRGAMAAADQNAELNGRSEINEADIRAGFFQANPGHSLKPTVMDNVVGDVVNKKHLPKPKRGCISVPNDILARNKEILRVYMKKEKHKVLLEQRKRKGDGDSSGAVVPVKKVDEKRD